MKFLSTLGIKREKRDRKATSHLYLLTRSSTDPIRFLVCKEQEQQEQQQKQTRRDKKKVQFPATRLDLFKQYGKTCGPICTRFRIFSSIKKAILENGNQVTHKNQKLGSLGWLILVVVAVVE
jgi:hypothetical protein